MSSPISIPNLDPQQQSQMFHELQVARNAAQQQQHQMEQLNHEIQRLRMAQASSSSSSSSTSGQSSNHDPLRNLMKVTPLNPSSFTGQTGNNANQWLVEMERYFAVTGISPEQSAAVRFAATYLKGPASVWYTSKYPDAGTEPTSWSQFKTDFLTRFRPFAAEKLARSQLRDLRQTRSVAEYSDNFLRTVQHIPDMHWKDQVDIYLHGLKAHISAEVDRIDPKSLSEAIELAQKEESRQYPSKGQRLPFYSNQQRRNIVPYSAYNSVPRAPAVDPNSMDINHMFSGGVSPSPYNYDPLSAFPPSLPTPPNYSQFLNAIGARSNNSDPDQEAQHQQRYNDLVTNWQLQVNAMHQRPSAGYRQNAPPFRRPTPQLRAPPMSQAEYERCRQLGLCFFCKQNGHVTKDCDGFKKSLNSSSR